MKIYLPYKREHSSRRQRCYAECKSEHMVSPLLNNEKNFLSLSQKRTKLAKQIELHWDLG